MKNAPEKIYLQIGEDVEPTEDFSKLAGVTWCDEKICKNDIEYVLSNKPNDKIDVYAIDIQKLRATVTDAEFRRLLTQYLK